MLEKREELILTCNLYSLISFWKAAIWSAIFTGTFLGVASGFLREDLALAIGDAAHKDAARDSD